MDFRSIPESIPLAGNVGAYAKPMAEHVMAMALALAKRLTQRHAALASGEFNQSEPLLTLDGAVCAILAFGGIGTATARLMRPFGARIHAVNTSGRTSEDVDFAGTLADLDEVQAGADILVVSLPLTNSTRGLLGKRELSLMKPAAILINVARGAIIDEQALCAHLAAHPEFCAGIDAWWHEPRGGKPFTTDYPFFDLPNVLGSPHTRHSRRRPARSRQDGRRERAPPSTRRAGHRRHASRRLSVGTRVAAGPAGGPAMRSCMAGLSAVSGSPPSALLKNPAQKLPGVGLLHLGDLLGRAGRYHLAAT